MAIGVEAAGFIGASVTLVLVIIFMILMVILVRQCLQFMAKRNALREQMEQQQQARQQVRRRRLSITEPVPATFDWHHSIRVEGTPPPSYGEAETLPTFEDKVQKQRMDGSKDDNIHPVEPSETKEEHVVSGSSLGTGTTPLISNGTGFNEESNFADGQHIAEVSIAVESSNQSHDHHTQSPVRLPQSHDNHVPSPARSSRSQEHVRVHMESPENGGFSSQYTEFDSATTL